jgi:hypothetical protein
VRTGIEGGQSTPSSIAKFIAGARCGTSLQELKNAVRPLTDVEFIKARAGFGEFEIVVDERGFAQN